MHMRFTHCFSVSLGMLMALQGGVTVVNTDKQLSADRQQTGSLLVSDERGSQPDGASGPQGTGGTSITQPAALPAVGLGMVMPMGIPVGGGALGGALVGGVGMPPVVGNPPPIPQGSIIGHKISTGTLPGGPVPVQLPPPPPR